MFGGAKSESDDVVTIYEMSCFEGGGGGKQHSALSAAGVWSVQGVVRQPDANEPHSHSDSSRHQRQGGISTGWLG
ncbi:unnamed protein product [Jaminaea pallidilutea]